MDPEPFDQLLLQRNVTDKIFAGQSSDTPPQKEYVEVTSLRVAVAIWGFIGT